MRDGFKVFDADAHVVEPKDIWDRFLDKRYQHRVGWKDVSPGANKFRPTTIDGVYAMNDLTIYGMSGDTVDWSWERQIEKYGRAAAMGYPGDLVAEAMREEGVDICVLYGPGYDPWVENIDPDLQAALVRAYNRWAQEMAETSKGRVRAAGPVPVSDITRAVTEIEYAYHELGIRCFWARPDVMNGRNLGDRYYDPMYELLQELDCAFATHEFLGLRGVFAGDRFRTYTEQHVVVHPQEAQCAIVSMILQGVFERFPRLRVAYLEAGSAWLSSFLARIDEHLELTGGREFPGLSLSATDYFLRNCWISTECDERYLRHTIDALGDDKIVFETDYPHPEAKFPFATRRFLDLDPDRISLDSKRKILWDNAVDLYRFPLEYMPTEFHEATAVREPASAR